MTDQERNQVLKMIEDGKITPEEGLHLMQALDQDPVDAIRVEAPQEQESRGQPAPVFDPRIENVKATVRRLWQIPLWIGIIITVLSAISMYAILRGPRMNFWFFFMLLPLLLGVAVIGLAVASRQAPWIFVDVRQQAGERPERIFLGFPLPIGMIIWILRTFGRWVPAMQKDEVAGAMQILETGFTGKEPLIVNVDEGDGGERVRVYIG